MPAYAAATLIYGLQMDAYQLLYSSRAFNTNRAAWDVLDACEREAIRCSPQKETEGPLQRTTIVDLPQEVILLIKNELARTTYESAVCESWLFFGPAEMHQYHPQYCCDPEREHNKALWPGRIQAIWNATLDELYEHFSFNIPQSPLSPDPHPVAEVNCGTLAL